MSDRILGGACVVVAAGMAWAAQGYVAEFSYEPVGPRAFPMLLAALMALGGLWLLFKPGRNDRWLHQVPIGAVAIAVLAVLAYALLFQTLGFTLATALMAVPVGMAFGGSWLKSLGGGVALGVLLYLGFDKLLDVVLPTGVLSFVLGGR
ncbi:MAG: tripartite tricarboxylate transporter TctB family protein [Proteobacteria bacterium]|nr:tripartite tricarboxylate transporter TctB family protein [Pseudomonadota bacterium]